MTSDARLRRARVVRIYDSRDTTVVVGPDGRAHELHAESAELAKVLLRFLLEPRSRAEIVAHIEALTGTPLHDTTVVNELVKLLSEARAIESVDDAPGPPPTRRHERLVLCLSGAVAAMNAPELIGRLLGRGFRVKVAATKTALRFISTFSVEALVHAPIASDMFEGETRVPHIDLANWADVVLVWPATATTLARLATGNFESIVSAIALATSAPVVVAPSMNAGMYAGAAVQRNIEQLVNDGMHVLHPSFGIEVADDPGERELRIGPAPPVGVVVQMVEAVLALSRAGKKHTPQTAAEWDAVYDAYAPEQLPWHANEPDADLIAALERLAPASRSVLDIGTGHGQLAVAAAERGHRVVATDISPRAVSVASERAPNAPVTWLADDVTNSHLHGRFDIVLDRGCLHLLTAEAAARYAKNLGRLLVRGGILLLKTHAAEEGNRHGTTPYTGELLKAVLGNDFEILEEHASNFPGPEHQPAARLFVVSRR